MSMDPTTEKLLSTTDAMVWAETWCETADRILDRGGDLVDVGWMIGWFANAMATQEFETERKWKTALIETEQKLADAREYIEALYSLRDAQMAEEAEEAE